MDQTTLRIILGVIGVIIIAIVIKQNSCVTRGSELTVEAGVSRAHKDVEHRHS